MKKCENQIVIIVVVFLLTIVAIIITIYVKNFGLNFSDSQSDWGAFGDYFGGLLNPIISSLNLAVLIWISFALRKIEDEAIQKTNRIQIGIALIQLKQNAYIECMSELSKLDHFVFNDKPIFDNMHLECTNLLSYMKHFGLKQDYLFNLRKNNEEFNAYISALSKLQSCISDITTGIIEDNNYGYLCDEYEEKKLKLILFLQRSVLEMKD